MRATNVAIICYLLLAALNGALFFLPRNALRPLNVMGLVAVLIGAAILQRSKRWQ